MAFWLKSSLSCGLAVVCLLSGCATLRPKAAPTPSSDAPSAIAHAGTANPTPPVAPASYTIAPAPLAATEPLGLPTVPEEVLLAQESRRLAAVGVSQPQPIAQIASPITLPQPSAPQPTIESSRPPTSPSAASTDDILMLMGSYHIEAGDSLEIKFRGTPEFNELVTVRPDGMISLQVAGDVPAAGFTPEQLRQTLNARFAAEVQRPEATVIVRSFAGNSIYVGGEVFSPGRVNLSGRMTTLNAIILAGGFKDTGDQRRVIVRSGDGRCCVYDIKSVIECKGGQNVQLQPYDIVYVPKSKIAKVNQFVDQYIEKVLPFSRSVGIFVSHNTGLGAAINGP